MSIKFMKSKFWINHFKSCILCLEKLRDPTQRGKGSAPGDPDKVERVRDEVARVKDIMVTNIEALLDRGERLDLLVDKTDQLSSSAVTFKQVSTRCDYDNIVCYEI